MTFRNVIDFVWKRHESHWNWIIMMCTLLIFLMSLWFHSIVLFFVCLAGVFISLCELPPAVPPFKKIDKILAIERGWLKAKWTWKKRMQAFGFLVGIVYVCASCWSGSIMAMLLFIGICVNLACVYGNKAMGVDEL